MLDSCNVRWKLNQALKNNSVSTRFPKTETHGKYLDDRQHEREEVFERKCYLKKEKLLKRQPKSEIQVRYNRLFSNK